ncbi:MAG: shikimate kinase [Treponema sp.]|nr:shikimate kinase [Treponema sp.]
MEQKMAAQEKIFKGIILVGPKHSGKTSTGKALANLLSGTFIDLDDEIALHSGQTPRALYRQSAELFRATELEATRKLVERINIEHKKGLGVFYIIATGGGIVDNPEAIELLKQIGPLVFLDLSTKTAWERIVKASERTGELPPFLKTENPAETHRILHERRSAAYRNLADLIINAEIDSPEQRAKEIVQLISNKIP